MSFRISSPEQMRNLGARLMAALRNTDPRSTAPLIIALSGPLGSGKTVLAQGIARELGVIDNVTSPTYTLVAEYDGTPRLIHVDLYRIGESAEVEMLGLEDALAQAAVIVVEWPERGAGHLPDPSVTCTISIAGHRVRTVSFDPPDLLRSTQ